VTVTSRYATPIFFHTDGSLHRCARFAIHRTEECISFGYKISSPTGIFTAEITVLFVALRQIEEIIQPSEKCMIPINSLNSFKFLLSRKNHIELS
jgi:hypothetical protein